MLKKAALAVFGLVLALSFSAPKAQAEVHVGVAIGTPAVYGSVAVLPVNHNTYYESYGYYDNAPNAYAYYDNPYATYNGTYYDSGRYYYAPNYRKHWRGREYGRDRHEYRHNEWERNHERWHGKHDHDRY